MSNKVTITGEEFTDIIWEAYPVDNLEWQVLGLCGEAGELANMVKKRMYKEIPDTELIGELEDVMWHVAQTAKVLGTTVEDIMQGSADKTVERNG